MSARPTEAVLLDIDGTLVDSTYHHALAWHRAWSAAGLDVPPLWRIHRTIGMGGDRLVAHVTDDETEERHGDELRDRWRKEYLPVRKEVLPLPGAADLVHHLRRQGYVVALASSGDPQFAQEAVDLLGIGDDVSALLSSADVDSSKPDPDLIGETLKRLAEDGADVERAVFVGDTVHDVESAKRAGMRCIALLSGGYSRGELEEAGAVLVVETPADLLEVDLDGLMSEVG